MSYHCISILKNDEQLKPEEKLVSKACEISNLMNRENRVQHHHDGKNMQFDTVTSVGSTLDANASGKFYQNNLMMTSHTNRLAYLGYDSSICCPANIVEE